MPKSIPKARMRTLPDRFFRRSSEVVAPELLGRYLVRTTDDGDDLILKIVEVEAYLGGPDRASHAWDGRRTDRNRALYLGGGHAYVYFIYGMHYCMNIVTGGTDNGDAVLLRAGEPVAGGEMMRVNRTLNGRVRPGDIAGGPGKLCRALAIDRSLDGVRIDREPLRLTAGEPVSPDEIAAGPRIGIDYAGDAVAWPLRFAIRGHKEMSRPRLK